ncbi:hypothetical protein BGZ81_008628 [Podila clonocystis]|nr:hypothetical protein BGZ81_008628 [Podila clonocystis]
MAEQSRYETQMPRFTEEEAANYQRPSPHILIVGAGLSGLYLAILLEQANISYQLFERTAQIKPLGAILSLNCGILPSMEQIGLYEDLLKIALPVTSTVLYKESMKKIIDIPAEGIKNILGYDFLVFPRPELYDLLLSRVPKEKILLGKKVISILQNKEGAMIRCSDNTHYHGDIIVGADGAYSGVRQSLYKQLSDENKLPACDAEQMSIKYSMMVGTTDALDREKYPLLAESSATHSSMVGDKGNPYTWSTFSVQNSKICWGVQVHLSANAAEDASFRNSEWGPETNNAIIKDVHNFNTPYGKLGELIDQTPEDRISRVFLEDKLFETWNHRRTVLIGDGAVSAMQDAVILANCIYDMASAEIKNVEAALADFRLQRYKHVKVQYEKSKTNAKLIWGQAWHERLVRQAVFGLIPKAMMDKALAKDGAYRPQIAFLPPAPPRGQGPFLPQNPSAKYLKLQAEQANAEREHASLKDDSAASN